MFLKFPSLQTCVALSKGRGLSCMSSLLLHQRKSGHYVRWLSSLDVSALSGCFPPAFPRFSSSPGNKVPFFLGNLQSWVELSPPSPENAAHICGLRNFWNTLKTLLQPCIQNFKLRAAVQNKPHLLSFRLKTLFLSLLFNTAAPACRLSGVRTTSTRYI
jgi:hypothetical protein